MNTATEYSDPYLHLEDVDASLEWVVERGKRTMAKFGGPDFERHREETTQILAAKDKLDIAAKRGEWMYNFYTDGDHPRGLWRRCLATEYLSKPQEALEWDVLLDVGALGEAEGTSWVFRGARLLYPSYDRALITLSPGGSDSNVVREFDVESRTFESGGFEKAESKGSMSWVDRDTVVIGADFGPGTTTDSGYPRQARLLRRGEDAASAPIIIEGEAGDVLAGAFFDHTPGFERLLAYRATDFRTTIMYEVDRDNVGSHAALRELQLPRTAEVGPLRDWALLTLRHDWELDGVTFAAGSLLAVPWQAALEGPRAANVQVLYAPTDTSSFLSAAETASGLVINTLDNVLNRIYFARDPHVGQSAGMGEAPVEASTHTPAHPHTGTWQITEITPEMASQRTVSISGVEPFTSDEVWVLSSGFITPSTLHHGTVSGAGLDIRQIRQAKERFNASGLEVRQWWATSKDGTRVPYFVVGPKDALDGKVPARTLLDGYGGFEVSRLPGYVAAYGKAWLEVGNVYAVANIRGGGEFGPRWHQAALKEHRHRAYEDFAAVAQDLVRRGTTTVGRLACYGGSNGGLLTGNMYTTYPELFGAIVCRVPLLDMKRYSHLLAGASWIGEYGDPDTDDWNYLRRYSPYHNVGAGAHPPILLTTSTRDDRVHPGHARKFQALLEARGLESYLYENTEGGHAGAADIDQAAFMDALIFSFLEKTLEA